MNAIRLLAAIILSGSSAAALAVPTMFWSTADTGPYSHTIDFESTGPLAIDTPVSTQFQTEGATFTGSVRANGCGFDYLSLTFGMSGNELNTSGPQCATNTVTDNFSLKLSTDVSRVAIDAYLRDSEGVDTIALYNDSLFVASFLPLSVNYVGLPANIRFDIGPREFVNTSLARWGILNIESNGAAFDEIRFTENNAQTSKTYITFDNLRFDAAAATSVPEPGTLALVFAGLLGTGLTRRRARAGRQGR